MPSSILETMEYHDLWRAFWEAFGDRLDDPAIVRSYQLDEAEGWLPPFRTRD